MAINRLWNMIIKKCFEYVILRANLERADFDNQKG